MISEEEIKNFIIQQDSNLSNREYNPKFFEQKIKCDVISVISNCILDLTKSQNKFNRKDLQLANYTQKLIREIFRKPETNAEVAENEYDKFFKQPLDYLSFYKVLERDKDHYYRIMNKDILDYLSTSIYNSLKFLNFTNQHLINCNKLNSPFDNFFKYQDKDSYEDLRTAWYNFIYSKTKIKNKAEPGRIFTPFINPIAFYKQKKGTEKGRVSKDEINFDDLIYNRPNWYDKITGKNKRVSRKEWIIKYNDLKAEKKFTDSAERYAMAQIKVRHNGNSEYSKELGATETHHIFPKSHFPEFRSYKENLIRLTPNEHRNKAHPDGKTQKVDKKFQKELLIKKSFSIEKSVNNNDGFYEVDNFSQLLSVCYRDKNFLNKNLNELRNMINSMNV